MPKINKVRGPSGITAISKCEVNLTKAFQDIAFTSNILYRVQTAVATILVFAECPKSIASEFLGGFHKSCPGPVRRAKTI